MDEKERQGSKMILDIMKNGKMWIIVIGLLLSGIVLWFGSIESNGFPEEKYTSVAAFVMLITTAFLQNIDLNLQRKDLQLNRKTLEEQREEMKKHTKEFEKTNISNNESLELQKFFELLKLKEELYVEVIKEEDKNGSNVLHGFHFSAYHKFKSQATRELYNNFKEYFETESEDNLMDYSFYNNRKIKDIYQNLSNTEKITFAKVVRDSFSDINIYRDLHPDYSLIKLYTYHSLLNNMVSEESLNILDLDKYFKNLLKFEKKPVPLKEIYNELLTNDERLLYSIFNKDFNHNDLFNIEEEGIFSKANI